LTASQLPQITQPDIAGINQYPDQPVINDKQSMLGITGQRQEKIAMIPTQAGIYELPEISIPWWNTQTNQQEIARLPARTFKVIGGPVQPATPVQPQTDTPKPAEQNSQARAESAKTAPALTMRTQSQAPAIWIIISVILGLGWLLTVLIWYRNARGKRARIADDFAKIEQTESIAVNLNHAKAQLKQACQDADKQAAKSALLSWARARWPEKNLASIGQITALVEGPLKQHIQVLDRVLYDPNATGWQPATFYTDLIEYEKQHVTNHKTQQDPLPKLYKVQ